MTYFADLSRCEYYDRRREKPPDLIAVGWLSSEVPYDRGPVDPEFVERLFDLIHTIWDPVRFRGYHTCEFCGRGLVCMSSVDGRTVEVGATNLFIPAIDSERMFVAPSHILHYVVDHEYRPPSSFQAAIMACPPTDSVKYFQLVGPRLPTDSAWQRGYFGRVNALEAALARASSEEGS